MSHQENPVTKEPGKELPDKSPQDTDPSPDLNPFAGASSWFNAAAGTGASWFSAARQKTVDTLDMVKKDLSEFNEVMKVEVSGVATAAKGGLNSATNVVREQAQYLEKLVTPDDEDLPETKQNDGKTGNADASDEADEFSEMFNKVEKSASMGFDWMKTVVGSVADTVKNLAVDDNVGDEEHITETIRPKPFRNTILSNVALGAIQTNKSTYLEEPENAIVYDQFMERFRIDEYDGEINMLLTNNPSMRQIYTQLVPKTLDAETFWSRYFYAVKLAEMDEEMKESFSNNDDVDKTSTAKESSATTTVVEQPTSPAKSQDDWSFCSEKNEVEELCTDSATPDEDEEPRTEPLTPKPTETEEETKNDVTEEKPKGKGKGNKKGKNSKKGNKTVASVPETQEDVVEAVSDKKTDVVDSVNAAEKKEDGWVDWDE